MDGGDLLALCQENLVYRRDLVAGIEAGLLCPFRYFGVPDDVDYSNIPWRSNRFDEEELTKAVATTRRAQNALEQFRQRAGSRTLGFCCSQRHADFMADYFSENGVRAVAVHSGQRSAPRASALEALADGRLDILFAVDMFNEGLDIPSVDTVLMLRPTESNVIWLQQFGRGLRQSQGKSELTVIDYIGNHKAFLDQGAIAATATSEVRRIQTRTSRPPCGWSSRDALSSRKDATSLTIWKRSTSSGRSLPAGRDDAITGFLRRLPPAPRHTSHSSGVVPLRLQSALVAKNAWLVDEISEDHG